MINGYIKCVKANKELPMGNRFTIGKIYKVKDNIILKNDDGNTEYLMNYSTIEKWNKIQWTHANFPLVKFEMVNKTVQSQQYKLIHNDKAIILIDNDGRKGIAKCTKGDEFDFTFGVALAKAKLEGDKDEIERLIEERYGDKDIENATQSIFNITVNVKDGTSLEDLANEFTKLSRRAA